MARTNVTAFVEKLWSLLPDQLDTIPAPGTLSSKRAIEIWKRFGASNLVVDKPRRL